MKFGKVLKVSSENMPAEMHDLFLRYKELKKQIKAIPVSSQAAVGNENQASVSPGGSSTGSGSAGQAAVTATVLSPEEQAFINTLNEDLTRFNRYFIEKEEEAVIRLQALCDELVAAAAAAGLAIPATVATTGLSDAEDAPSAAAPAPAPAAVASLQPHRSPAAVLPQHQLQREREQQRAGVAPDMGQEAQGGLAGQGTQVAQAAGPSAARQEPGDAGVGQPANGHHVAASEQQAQQQEQEQPSQPRPHHHHHHHGLQPLQDVKSRLVQFHGEMVLLLHWSLLNYAAVVKILKKHDKRTGVLLRAPYLANVLQQPFSSTTIMSRLAKRAEELVVATTQLTPTAPRAAAEASAAVGAGGGASPSAAGADSGAAATATDTAVADGSIEAGGAGDAAAGAAAAGPSGRETTSASDASSLTLAGPAEREAGFPKAPGLAAEPLVGSTMHALETWANLRKNAITPSTVLVAEAEAAAGAKRKADAMTPEPDAAAAPPAGKAGKL